ncbi:MAG: peptidoglycan-binding protein, partial [Patescibacteria group bacterium]
MSQSRQQLIGLCLVLLVTMAIAPATTNAQTATTTATSTATTTVATSTPTNNTNISNLLTLLKSLMKQVEDLKKQIAGVQSELKDGLQEGMTDEDVKKVQELLATDPTLYPRGLVTGYYGPMTKEAVSRFQARHELKVSGEVDSETKALILEYFKERTNGQIPPGLLRAPGIDKKIKMRMTTENGEWRIKCEDKKGAGFLCKEKLEDDEDEESEDENASSTKNVSTTTVETAINDAEEAIQNLEDAISESSTSTKAIKKAENALDDAEDKLAEAEEELADKKLRSAFEKAVKAEMIAEKGLAELQ